MVVCECKGFRKVLRIFSFFFSVAEQSNSGQGRASLLRLPGHTHLDTWTPWDFSERVPRSSQQTQPSAEFEPAIPAIKRVKKLVLDRDSSYIKRVYMLCEWYSFCDRWTLHWCLYKYRSIDSLETQHFCFSPTQFIYVFNLISKYLTYLSALITVRLKGWKSSNTWERR